MRPSFRLSKPPHAELCAPGSGKSTVLGGDYIGARAMDRSRGSARSPAAPREVRVWGAPFGLLRPAASPLPAAQQVAERSSHEPRGQAWALCPSLARGCCRALFGHRGSPAGDAMATAARQPNLEPQAVCTACAGGKFPQLQRGSEVCVPNFPRFQTSASIKRSRMREEKHSGY